MQISLRPARPQDFDYCAQMYFAEMEKIIRELNLSMEAQVRGFREQWDWAQVRIVSLADRDVGWLQTRTEGNALFLAQLFVDASFQRQGIGTEVMHRVMDEATRGGQAVTLAVVKINPALRLYQRLGFQITHEDDRKFYMKRESNAVVERG